MGTGIKGQRKADVHALNQWLPSILPGLSNPNDNSLLGPKPLPALKSHQEMVPVMTNQDDVRDISRYLLEAEYRRRAEDPAFHRAQAVMGFLHPRIVMGPRSGLQPVFSSALARARADAAREQRPLPELTDQNSFLITDIIIADMGDPDTWEGRSPPVAYALFEASITADERDVQKAAAEPARWL